ncbi:MAG: BlaI/MecI/CopY family transcriptional regulator [Myxococcales bacterium]|nr:BlaI/MecI/CopY family transcriptional regulator [Myxococcales bacterium]
MSILWQGEPMAVRSVMANLKKKLAYTTVMTTLDRLYKKGLLARELDGSAFVYRARLSRDDFHRKLVEETVGGLLEESAASVLAAFVDTAAEVDEDNLKKLEALIAERRKRK